MRRPRSSWLGILSFLFLASPTAVGAEEVISRRYPLPAGGQVSVDNVQGSISVEGWDKAEVELTAIKSAVGATAGAREVEIGVTRRGGRLAIRTLHPADADPTLRVDYRLRVPRQVRLEGLHTVNGHIRVREVEGSVEARTLNGNIEQSGIVGSVMARALNGGIHVALRRLPGREGRVQLETINGHLHLVLPPGANAELEVSTVAGRVQGGLVLAAGPTADDTAWRARLGGGGPRIQLRTVRGDIHVEESEGVL